MPTDYLGRDLGQIDSKALLRALKSETNNKVLETKDVNTESAIKKISDLMEDIEKKIDQQAKEAEKRASEYAKAVIKLHEEKAQRVGKKPDKENSSKLGIEAKLTRKAVEKMVKMGGSPNTFWVGVGHFHGKAIRQLKDILISCGICRGGSKTADAVANAIKSNEAKTAKIISTIKNSQSQNNGGGGNGNNGGNGMYNNPENPDFDGTLRNIHLIGKGLNAIAIAAMSINSMFEVDLTNAWKGILVNSNRFREKLRAVIFETQGFVETNRQIEKEFINIEKSVAASGVSAGEFQEKWVENIKRGFAYMSKTEKLDKSRSQILERQIKTHKSVQTTALNTATALGVSTDSINELFMSWHMQLGLSANELANIGRSMKQISLNTGLTGIHLEKAMKSADSVMKSLRNTGALTDMSAKNVMGMIATAQKLGIDETITPLMQAMSGGSAMFDADENTKKLLNAIMTGQGAGGRPNDMYWAVRSGAINQDKDLMKQGHQNMTARAQMALRASGVQNAENIDLSNLSEAMKNMSSQQQAVLQTNFKNMLGTLPVEFEKVIQTFEEQMKTEGERLADLSNRVKEYQEKGLSNTDEFKALIRQKDELETGNIQTVFGKIADRMKEGMNFENARLQTQKELAKEFGPEYASDLIKDLGRSSKNLMDKLSDRAKAAGKDLNSLMSSRGMDLSEIKEALISGNADQRDSASKIMNEAIQEISQAEKQNSDPISSINETVRLINNKLEQIVNSMFFSSDLLTKTVFWASQLASIMTSMFGVIRYIPDILELLGPTVISGFSVLGKMLWSFGGSILKSVSGIGKWVIAAAPSMLKNAKTIVLATSKAFIKNAPMIAKGLGSALTKVLGPLGVAIGAISGFMESTESGRSPLEGALFGALTGGAGTGSMFSEMFGLEKGGMGDKILGVFGSTAFGASLGAAIGSLFGGVGAVPGALIGGLIGAVVEIIKILTEGSDAIANILSPIEDLINGIWEAVKGIGNIIAGFFTLDIGRMFDGLYQIVDGIIGGIIRSIYSVFAIAIPEVLSLLWSGFKAIVIDLPMMIMDGIISAFKFVFSDLPSIIGGFGTWIKEGLSSLKDNEYIGPIISVLSESFDAIYNGWMSIYNPIMQIVDSVSSALSTIFSPISEILSSISGSTSDWTLMGTAMSALQITVHVLAQGISLLLQPLVWLSKLIGGLLSIIGYGVQTVADFANSISNIVNFAGTIGSSLYEGITGVFSNIATTIYDGMTNAFSDVGTWLYDNVIGSLLDLIPDWLKSGASAISSVAKAVSDPVGTAKNVMGSVGSALGSAGSAILDWVNPFSYFQEGTKEIKQTGLAMLHEGEMILPKNVATAVGDGPFPKTVGSSTINTGAFESGQGSEAISTGFDQKTSEMLFNMPSKDVDAKGDTKNSYSKSISNVTGGLGLGLFHPENIIDAMRESVDMIASVLIDPIESYSSFSKNAVSLISESLDKAFNTKSHEEKKESSFADTGKSLYYSDVTANIIKESMGVVEGMMKYSPLGMAFDSIIGDKGQTSTNLMDYSDSTKGQTSTNLMDYSDAIKGTANTSMYGLGDYETRVAQEKYGSVPSGGLIPGMENVEDYLAQEQNLLKIVVQHLSKIEQNTSNKPVGETTIIGKRPTALPASSGLRMRRISQEQSSGEWDVSFGDNSPSSVTMG